MTAPILTMETVIIRSEPDGRRYSYDVTIHFVVEDYTPGYAASRWEPGNGTEYDLSVVDMEMNGLEDEDQDLTAAEREELKHWFDEHYIDASEIAEELYGVGA